MLIMGKISLPKMSKPTVTLLLLLVALGVAEKIGLSVLFWFSVVLTAITSLLQISVLIAYTIGYWKNIVCKSCGKS